MENPYQSPETSSQIEETTVVDAREYGGIGRAVFVILALGCLVFLGMALRLILLFLNSDIAWAWLVVGLFMLLLLGAFYARLKNLGTNPFWCLLLFVPLVNLLILAPCVIGPAGYNDGRKLDRAGKVMTGIVVALLVFGAFVLFG